MNSKGCSCYSHHQQQLGSWLKAILRVSCVWIKNLKFKRSCPEDRIQLDQAPDELFYKTFVMRFFFFYLFFFVLSFIFPFAFLFVYFFHFFLFTYLYFAQFIYSQCFYQQCVTAHHVPKGISCHKFIVGRAYCLHDFFIISRYS